MALTMSFLRKIVLLVGIAPLFVLISCSSDEDNQRPPQGPASVMNVRFTDARVIEVNSNLHRALIMHDRNASSGTALEYVDLDSRSVISSEILVDYLDVYDVKFVSPTEACFAGRPHGHIGYAVHFFSLPDLTLGSRVLVTADTAGRAGGLAVDSLGGFVYYSHAGGGEHDGIYKIRTSNKTVVDADDDGVAPFALDNNLVRGLFDGPATLFYDRPQQKLVVANAQGSFVTMFSAAMWGTMHRPTPPNWPEVASHLPLPAAMGVSPASTMAYGDGVYVFAGLEGNENSLGRFTIGSVSLDLLNPVSGVTWMLEKSRLNVHPRPDVVSVFIVQQDTSGVGIGQYNLNNLEATGPVYQTRFIPDSTISAVGLDVVSDELIVADSSSTRLEFLDIE
jgi:hypothetical protein